MLPYGFGRWVVASIVGLVWFMGQTEAIRLSRQILAAKYAALAAGLQLLFLILFTAWATQLISTAPSFWLASLPFLVGAAVVVLYLERMNQLPLPRYGLEALLLTCFSAVYLLVCFRSVAPLISCLLVIHGGIFCLVVVRNSRVVTEHSYGPVQEGDYVKEAWSLQFRDPAGVKAVIAAICLPSGLLGLIFIIVEFVALLIGLHQ
jgi:TctA family transporter